MQFKEISPDQAENTILAHSLNLPDRKLKKGSVLSRKDVTDLEKNNYVSVMVAILDTEDISEDIAASDLASAIAGDRVKVENSVTGRCNLRAESEGLIVIDKDLLDKANLVHESLSIATIEPFTHVQKGQLIVTVKVIPYGVTGKTLQSCLSIVDDKAKDIVRVAPFQPKRIGFIQTRVDSFKESILDKTTKVLNQRLRRLNSEISREIRCQHDQTEVEKAILQLFEQNIDMLIISGATAVADRGDVVPSAIVCCGGEIIHFGMPVDPGNLLLISECRNKYVLGMPGCARSPKLNGFDIVLDRLAADIPVTSRDIMAMGVGGLLKEITDRPQPRVVHPEKKTMSQDKKISAVVLAAGQSSRMGSVNKLLVKVNDQPMIEDVVSNLKAAYLHEITVVTGFEAEKIEAALDTYDVQFENNPDYAKGMSTSLVAGLQCIDKNADAVIICLGDMPLVTTAGVKQLCDGFDPDSGHEICVPTHEGKRGNPVLWSRRFIQEMLQIEGDIGAKHLLFKYDEFVNEIPMQDSGALIDFDTQRTVYDYQNNQGTGGTSGSNL